MKDGGPPGDGEYRVPAMTAEAYLGVGDEAKAEQKFQEAPVVATADRMKESTRGRMEKLRGLLTRSPLKYVKTEGE